MKSYSSLFEEAQSSSVTVGSETLYSMYELAVPPSVFTFEFVSYLADPVQGISLDCTSEMLINGENVKKAVLWTDTAPPVVSVQINKTTNRKAPVLRFWNVWRVGTDTIQAWVGNSAMKIESTGQGSIIVRCSSGAGAPNFGSLVFRVSSSTDG